MTGEEKSLSSQEAEAATENQPAKSLLGSSESKDFIRVEVDRAQGVGEG